MDQQQQSHRRKQVLWAAGIVAALAFSITVFGGYLFEWKWTGLPGRTAWDWLALLIVPAVLAVGGVLFSQRQQTRDRVSADRRAQDDALEAYLDDMTDLMTVHHLRSPSQGEDPEGLRAVARARTLTLLRRLDGERKAHVVQFLYESGLIRTIRTVVDLHGADLSGADLSGASMFGADLIGADLSGANLFEARGWTEGQLSEARTLVGATMPNGQKYEDWLNDREKRQQDE